MNDLVNIQIYVKNGLKNIFGGQTPESKSITERNFFIIVNKIIEMNGTVDPSINNFDSGYGSPNYYSIYAKVLRKDLDEVKNFAEVEKIVDISHHYNY